MTAAYQSKIDDLPEVALWELVSEVQPDPELALTLLAKAVAYGCNSGDYWPGTLLQLIREDFDRLHIAKHMGRRQ